MYERIFLSPSVYLPGDSSCLILEFSNIYLNFAKFEFNKSLPVIIEDLERIRELPLLALDIEIGTPYLSVIEALSVLALIFFGILGLYL